MSEWSKEHAWKVCIPLKGIQGSNPCLSANQFIARFSRAFLFYSVAKGSLSISYETKMKSERRRTGNKLILASPQGINEVNPCLVIQ